MTVSPVVAPVAVGLRPATPADAAACAAWYASTRGDLAALGPAAAPLIASQHTAREAHYAATRPGAEDAIMTLDGAPVGRLLLDRTGDPEVIVDIVVAADLRGRGIGTAVLREVLAGAFAAGRGVALATAPGSGTGTWYTRLGFVPTGEAGGYTRWEARP